MVRCRSFAPLSAHERAAGNIYQIFTMAGEPRTCTSNSETYASPAEAEQAGRAVVAILNGRLKAHRAQQQK